MRRSVVIRREPECQLVDHQKARLDHHHPAQRGICCSPPDRLPALWSIRRSSSGKRLRVSSSAARARWPSRPQGLASDLEVLAHREPGKRHLAADEQRCAELDDLLGFQIGAVAPEYPDDAAVGMVEARHRAEERGLAGAVGPEERGHLTVCNFEVDVEEHLLVAVEEVEVVHLERRYRPSGLTALTLGVAFEHVLDDESYVPADEA